MLNNNYNLLGVMQGRLLKKYRDRYQAHPINYWQEEFQIAKKLRLQCIEFIFDYNDYNLNPLMSSQGIQEIKKYTHDTSVLVKTICADYFMEAPIHSSSINVYESSVNILNNLIVNSNKIGVKDIVIPCVDQSSLMHEKNQINLIKNLQKPIELASKFDVNLALETDLPPKIFAGLLGEFDSNIITVNYDTGNSASLGYDMSEEFKCYGERISDIHIKDRELGGGSVLLGTGATNFSLFFEILSTMNFKGPIVMQAFRDKEGLEIFKKQFNWLKKSYNNYGSNYSS